MAGTGGVVFASLNHLRDLPLYKTERPYEIWLNEVPNGLKKTNVEFGLHDDIPIEDVRQRGLDNFSIEKQGFEFLHQLFPNECSISGTDAENETPEQRAAILQYLDIMAAFLCKKYDGVRAVCYDWRVRRSRGSPINKIPRIYTLPDEVDARKITIDVAHQVHADGSPNGIKKSLSYLLSDPEKKEISERKYRLRVINVWRPLRSPVEIQPLALCDRTSVQESDWEQVEKVQTNWVEESMYLKRNERHKWYWLSNQTPDEVTSFVVWDSERSDSLSTSVPHCSFRGPPPQPDAKPRESIEVRYLLWTSLDD